MLALGGIASADEITLTAFNTHIDYSNHEIYSDWVLTRSDGTSEVYSGAVGEDLFWFSGTSNVPPATHLDLEVDVTPLGGGGGGGVFIPNQGIGGVSAAADVSTDGQIQVLPAFLVWLGTGAISATSCAAGWMMSRRVLISDCERQGRGFSSISVGACGVGPGSSIDCDIEEENGENNALISWNNFARFNLPWTYPFQNNMLDLSIPSDY